MTNSISAELSARGLACTLPVDEQGLAALEWSDVAALATSADYLENGVRLTIPDGHGEPVNDLVGRENECCGSWLRAEITTVDGDILLTVTSQSPDGVAVLHRMAGLPSEVRR